MYCDQPSLLTRDPGGRVNKEIPNRWGKQPHRILTVDPWSYLTINSHKHPLVELPCELLALGRRTLGGKRHRYVIARPEKLGVDGALLAGNAIDTQLRDPRNSGLTR